ncbi:hypothetical protein [Tateyamaria omphalii]|uniref:Phage tail protein n=1 Tax=Tateyamaria omphalii TaxID=299262 RepID=A0A1P8MV48_9RHOB|nr:hypothetical protein [Tateyamaria omphalii]APX11977.1 hypothetical protein BWR18_10035 [Tateyamaria omphalii]
MQSLVHALIGVPRNDERADGAVLRLALHPDAAPGFDASDGSFGGLVLPRNVARAADGGLLLLDVASGVIKRFDGCTCRFNTIPHTGGLGEGARQFSAPDAMATCGEMLLVADAGHRRVSVFSQFGYALRAHWTPPVEIASNPWQPVDIAAMKGRIAVADPANGAVHFISPQGQWVGVKEGLGAVRGVTFDRRGALYVTTDGVDGVRVIEWGTGTLTTTVARPDLVRDAFAARAAGPAPIGVLNLTGWCHGAEGLFDLTGAKLSASAGNFGAVFERTGQYLSDPLDSRLYRCHWDRVLLTLVTPPGTSVRVLTYTAEVAKSQADIAALPPDAWAATPPAMAGSVAKGEWDALIRSEPGRFLWLRLDLSGDGEVTPEVRAVEIDFPRISLRRYLPAVFGEEPLAADFTDRFLANFDRGLRSIEKNIDGGADFYDPLSAPAEPGRRDFLSWLAGWVGVTLDRQLPLARRRHILKSIGKLFPLRGTKRGLRETLYLYLGLDQQGCPTHVPRCGPCTTKMPHPWAPPELILEHFSLRRWLFVGIGRLGNDAKLWGERIVNRSRLSGNVSGLENGAQLGVTQLNTVPDPNRDPFHVYAHRFSVFLPAWIGRLPGQRRMIERLVRAESPAHSLPQIEWVAPRFRIGVQAMIGFDAVIGCYPQQIELGKDRLGRATVLPSADGRSTPPRVGKRGRIGSGVL